MTTQTRQIGKHKTRIYVDEEGYTNIQYWNTAVCRFNEKEIILNSDGHQTTTTKKRMNQTSDQYNLGLGVTQKAFQWYISFGGKQFAFRDGITLNRLDNTIRNGATTTELLKRDKQRKEIKDYVKGFVTALVSYQIPRPSGGDCWYCSMFKGSDTEHLQEHIKEEYYVPSLLMNAVTEFPISIFAREMINWYMSNNAKEADKISAFGSDSVKVQITKSLENYLYRYLKA